VQPATDKDTTTSERTTIAAIGLEQQSQLSVSIAYAYASSERWLNYSYFGVQKNALPLVFHAEFTLREPLFWFLAQKVTV